MARTEIELVEGLKHVSYELWMVAETTGQLAQFHHSTYVRGPALDNALLESMLLHTRSLVEFFLGNRPRPDDLHRGDFADQWTPGPAPAVARVEADRVRLHKHLSHLTWLRFDDGEQKWDVWALATAIVQIADEWSKHLLSEGRHAFYDAFSPGVANALTILGSPHRAYPVQPRST